MHRNLSKILHQVIEVIKEAKPLHFEAIIHELSGIADSASYCPPENMGLWWREAMNVLSTIAPVDTQWKARISVLFVGDESQLPPQYRSGQMTVAEAGRKGGNAVKASQGPEFFEKIGRMGGSAAKEKLGSEHYKRIGAMGGKALKTAHGSEHFKQMGKKGGDAVKAKMGPDFYKKIGSQGGQKIKALIEAGKAAVAQNEADAATIKAAGTKTDDELSDGFLR